MMDWQGKFNDSINYIEERLETRPGEETSNTAVIEAAARITGNSVYEYQRLFSNIMGIPPGEYMRRRRLSLAAAELQEGIIRVTDVAFKYGYESLEAFSRAFKLVYGLTPSGIGGGIIRPYPRQSVEWSVKSGTGNEPVIVKKEAFEMFGVSALIGRNGGFTDVPSFFLACAGDGTLTRINTLLGRPGTSFLHGAVYGFSMDDFRYMICMFAPKLTPIPGEYKRLSAAAGTWAVFDVTGSDVMPVWRYISTEWLPESGYRLTEEPSFEMYYGDGGHKNAFTELWVQVCER